MEEALGLLSRQSGRMFSRPKNGRWVRNPIDAVIVERLEKEKLQPSSRSR